MVTDAQLTQWQVEGNSAEAYERFLVPAIFREGAENLIEHAAIQPGERVLDVGCGTGIVARTAAGRTGTVEAVDPNTSMLEVARDTAADASLEITWHQGAAESLPRARNSCDVVVSQQAYQFFEDREKALGEMYRVLDPGGRAVVSVLRSVQHNHTYQPLINAFRRHGSDELGTMMQSPFQDLTMKQLRDAFLKAGFRSASVTISLISARFPSIPDFLQQELSSSPLSGVVSTMDDNVREAIARDVSADLSDYIDDQGVIHPLQTWLIKAQA